MYITLGYFILTIVYIYGNVKAFQIVKEMCKAY